MNIPLPADLATTHYVTNLMFHLFMLFVAIYSGLIVFALVRFGRSKLIGLAASLLYILVLATLYGQATNLIAIL